MDISIVIPCYNHGRFIQDAIDSVEALSGVEFEIIIVDDGSTETFTKQKIAELQEAGYIVISHPNSGLAYSRNAGVEIAKGRLILPLDADNKISHEYVYTAIEVFNQNQADIVYANPIYFGENNPKRYFTVKSFDGNELLEANYIDACAIFKKEVWQQLGGYDEAMPRQGQEDWEFWINAFVHGYKFFHINKGLYYYRISSGSMIESTISTGYGDLNYEYIVKKHLNAFISSYKKKSVDSKIYNRDKSMPLRSSFKYLFKYIKTSLLNR